jgi:hypothetical protein
MWVSVSPHKHVLPSSPTNVAKNRTNAVQFSPTFCRKRTETERMQATSYCLWAVDALQEKVGNPEG